MLILLNELKKEQEKLLSLSHTCVLTLFYYNNPILKNRRRILSIPLLSRAHWLMCEECCWVLILITPKPPSPVFHISSQVCFIVIITCLNNKSVFFSSSLQSLVLIQPKPNAHLHWADGVYRLCVSEIIMPVWFNTSSKHKHLPRRESIVIERGVWLCIYECVYRYVCVCVCLCACTVTPCLF